MKTRIKGLLAILLGLFMFSSIATKAQCPRIQNRTNCEVKLIISQYKKDPQTGMCTTNLCSNPVTIIVPAGAVMPINPCVCPSCISITVVGLNGLGIPPVTVNNFGTPGPLPLSANPCGATAVRYDASIPAFVIF